MDSERYLIGMILVVSTFTSILLLWCYVGLHCIHDDIKHIKSVTDKLKGK
jgi:hypothetical protein